MIAPTSPPRYSRQRHLRAPAICTMAILLAGCEPHIVTHLAGVSDDGRKVIFSESLLQVFFLDNHLYSFAEDANYVDHDGVVTRIEASVGNSESYNAYLSVDPIRVLKQTRNPYDYEIKALEDGSVTKMSLWETGFDFNTEYVAEEQLSRNGNIVLVDIRRDDSLFEFWRFDVASQTLELLPLPYAEIAAIPASPAGKIMATDGGRVAFSALNYDDFSEWRTYLYDRESNSTEQIHFSLPAQLEAAGIDDRFFALADMSAEGNRLLLERTREFDFGGEDVEIPDFFTFDIADGASRPVYLPDFNILEGLAAMSHNGQFLAYTDDWRNSVPGALLIRVRDLQLGTNVAIPLPELANQDVIGEIAIGNDGQVITFETPGDYCGVETCSGSAKLEYAKVWQHDRVTGVNRQIVTNAPYPPLSSR